MLSRALCPLFFSFPYYPGRLEVFEAVAGPALLKGRVGVNP